MAQRILNINTDGVARHTARLEQMHRSALPNAIRGTLNGMAFDVKKNTMPREAQQAFVNRRANFFKATSKVESARGWNVDQMKATVGFVGGERNQAIEDLEVQEHGGTIRGRSFIPTKGARVSKSNRKAVATRNRISTFGRVVNTNNASGKTRGERFIKSVVFAGKGGIVIRDNAVFRVKTLRRGSKGKWRFKLDLIYTYERGRKVRIQKASHFMEKASKRSAKKGPMIFAKEAERQMKRLQR